MERHIDLQIIEIYALTSVLGKKSENNFSLHYQSKIWENLYLHF